MNRPIYISNFCPICQRAVQQSAILNIDKPTSGWVVFCEDGAWCHMLSSKDGIERIVYMSKVAMEPNPQMKEHGPSSRNSKPKG